MDQQGILKHVSKKYLVEIHRAVFSGGRKQLVFNAQAQCCHPCSVRLQCLQHNQICDPITDLTCSSFILTVRDLMNFMRLDPGALPFATEYTRITPSVNPINNYNFV